MFFRFFIVHLFHFYRSCVVRLIEYFPTYLFNSHHHHHPNLLVLDPLTSLPFHSLWNSQKLFLLLYFNLVFLFFSFFVFSVLDAGTTTVLFLALMPPKSPEDDCLARRAARAFLRRISTPH